MNTNHYKIIILDDNLGTLETINDIIVNSKISTDIFCFPNVDDNFWDVIEDIDVDLFIVDIRLGTDDGRNITDEIIKRKRGVIFLFISGYDFSLDSLIRFKGRCVYDFMAKPITPEPFITRIQCLLNISQTYKVLVNDVKNFANSNEENSIYTLRKKYEDMLRKDRMMIRSLKESIMNVRKQI